MSTSVCMCVCVCWQSGKWGTFNRLLWTTMPHSPCLEYRTLKKGNLNGNKCATKNAKRKMKRKHCRKCHECSAYVCVWETEVKQQNIIKNWGAIYWKTTWTRSQIWQQVLVQALSFCLCLCVCMCDGSFYTHKYLSTVIVAVSLCLLRQYLHFISIKVSRDATTQGEEAN